MRKQLAIWLIATAVVVAACGDERTPTSPTASPRFAISDGAHSGGNPRFFFLPPLVANPAQSLNFGAAEFNPLLQPVVRVFLLPAGAVACDIQGLPVFGPAVATRDAGEEHYKVEWDTRASGLAAGANYRICVFSSLRGGVLGYLDVSPVVGGMKKLAGNDTYAFQDGRTLPVKFRIEEGALCAPEASPEDCTEFTVGTTGGDFTVPSKHAGLSVPAGAVREGDIVTVVVETETPQHNGECLPTDIIQSKGCYHFRSEPALYEFAVDVRLEACVNPEDLDPAALRLYKYNETQGLQQLPLAEATLIDCTDFIAQAEPAGSRSSTFAQAMLRDLGRWADRLFGPRALYARPPMPPPSGLGGMGGSFSDVGGAVPGTATQAEVLLTVPAIATVGQAGLVATASGGSGTGAYSYASSTPAVCTVGATTGNITALTPGTCSLTATKAADQIYRAATSDPGSFSVVLPGLPDLVVSSVVLQTGRVIPGGNITFSYTVSNIGGEGPAGNSTFDVAVYLSTDQQLDQQDVHVGWGYSVWTYHLSVGWSHTITMSDRPIPDDVPLGTYYLIVVADAFPGQPPNYYPGVTEANETNNWMASPSTLTVISP